MASNGLEALGRIARTRFDAVLMDVQMPGMDGLAATRSLRARPEMAGVPIIAVTADTEGMDGVACRLAGMNDLVAKPIVPSQLQAALLRWLPPRGSVAPVPQPAPTNAVQEPDDFQHLESLLRCGDFEAEVAYRAIRPAFRTRYGACANEFESALAAYDHERACTLLGRLRRVGGSPARR